MLLSRISDDVNDMRGDVANLMTVAENRSAQSSSWMHSIANVLFGPYREDDIATEKLFNKGEGLYRRVDKFGKALSVSDSQVLTCLSSK